MTDDDRNAFAATDAEHIMIMKVMKDDDDDVHMGEEDDDDDDDDDVHMGEDAD